MPRIAGAAVAAWRAELQRVGALHGDALARVPRVVVTSQVTASSTRSRVLTLQLTPEALKAAAAGAARRKTGARGLRTIIEGVLLDVMYEIPSRPDIRKCVVSADCVTRHQRPLLVTESGQVLSEEGQAIPGLEAGVPEGRGEARDVFAEFAPGHGLPFGSTIFVEALLIERRLTGLFFHLFPEVLENVFFTHG